MTSVHVDDPSFRLTTHERVVLVRAVPPPSADAVRQLEAALRQTKREHGEVGLLITYDFSRFAGPLPDADLRARMSSLLRETELFGMAVVVDRQGFFGSAVRSMVTGVLMVARVPFRVRIFADADEACRWLAEQTAGTPLDASALRTVLHRLAAARNNP